MHKVSRRPPYPQNRIGEYVGKAVLKVVWKARFGQVRVADELTRQGLFVSPWACAGASKAPPSRLIFFQIFMEFRLLL